MQRRHVSPGSVYSDRFDSHNNYFLRTQRMFRISCVSHVQISKAFSDYHWTLKEYPWKSQTLYEAIIKCGYVGPDCLRICPQEPSWLEVLSTQD